MPMSRPVCVLVFRGGFLCLSMFVSIIPLRSVFVGIVDVWYPLYIFFYMYVCVFKGGHCVYVCTFMCVCE